MDQISRPPRLIRTDSDCDGGHLDRQGEKGSGGSLTSQTSCLKVSDDGKGKRRLSSSQASVSPVILPPSLSSSSSIPPPPPSLRFVDRIEHFTWAWYTLPMSTGGLSLLLAPQTQPHTFDGLETIGKVVYIWDLFLFVAITATMTIRFVRFPHTLRSSLTHPTESLFFATSLLSVASIVAGVADYGIPVCGDWLVVVYRVLFWIYFALTFCQVTGQYFHLFVDPSLKIEDMTPAWDLPVFPFMLSGTVAAAGVGHQPPDQAVPMIVAGLTAQGLGMMVTILMYASYLRRMIQFGFPSPNSRPGMFIAVGPPSFTALALIGLANNFPAAYGEYFGDDDGITIQVLRIMATVTAVFIWSLSLWFFCISVLANLARRRQMSFHLNWWAFVFPNVGFTIALINIGKIFRSQGILWVGSVMTVLLVLTYLCVLACHVRAVARKDILWAGKDEDVYITERKFKAEILHQKGRSGEARDLEKGKTS